MSEPAAAGTGAPIARPSSTGSTTTVALPAFTVDRVTVPEKWDPSTQSLVVGWDITDTFGRIRKGRIRYEVFHRSTPDADGEVVVVHEQALTAGQLRMGCHEMPAADRWDGTISQGLTDRVGEKVTGDISPVTVRVEAWNTNDAEPGTILERRARHGRTEVEGQYLSRSSRSSSIDIIAEARWVRNFVIPYDDPDEPQHGFVAMRIRLKNVRVGSPVQIQVLRIADTGPADDAFYAGTNTTPDEQPGLENIIVAADGRALVEGRDPEVRFNNYNEHWTQPGNNFYRFEVAIGPTGGFVEGSPRDVAGREAECLHLRFTVFIFSPASDLGISNSVASQCHQLFRNDTKYWRSFHRRTKMTSVDQYRKLTRRRYAVIYEGHAGAQCFHADHPKKPDGNFIPVMRDGFAADGNVCPIPPAPPAPRPGRTAPTPRFAGCGNKERTHMYIPAGTGLMVFNYPVASEAPTKLLLVTVTAARRGRPRTQVSEDFDLLDGGAPRLVFWNDACRTILSTNFSESMHAGGTRYYHGYRYISYDRQAVLTTKVFRAMIKGTRDDPATTEYEADRLGAAYAVEAVKRAYRANHPRLSDNNTLSGMVPPPDAGEAASR